MRSSRLLSVVLALLLIATAVAAQSSTQTDFEVESQLLQRELEQYSRARERERTAIIDFRRLAEQVDATMLDPNAALSSLRDLEAQFSVARETAYLRTRETGEIRLRMYDRMERLGQLAQALERVDPAVLADRSVLTGNWQIALEPLDVHGLMKLVAEGQVVTGSYRMSNGNRGSLQGTWSGGRLELEVVHAELGPVGTLEGNLTGGSQLRGRWNAMELGSGEAAAGSWRAHRIADD